MRRGCGLARPRHGALGGGELGLREHPGAKEAGYPRERVRQGAEAGGTGGGAWAAAAESSIVSAGGTGDRKSRGSPLALYLL